MRNGLIILLLSINSLVFSQVVLTIEGRTFPNGEDITHSSPTALTFRYNAITGTDALSYSLLAGDEAPLASNNNLDGAIITGNSISFSGTILTQHGIFVGYNVNQIINYNYVNRVAYGVVFKSGNPNITNTSGGFSYNIVKNSEVAVRIKGINGVVLYNNTFYNDVSGTNGFIYISGNPDNGNSPSTGTIIKNNIFYTTLGKGMIYIDTPGNLSGFQCDYNVYYDVTGSPKFYNGTNWLTFSQWQALGYDKHSVVLNPNFNNNTDLLPVTRLDYGTNIGSDWQTGLSINASWDLGIAPSTANQNGIWQVGAHIYTTSAETPYYISSVIDNNTPGILEIAYNLSLASVIPSISAFNVLVNSDQRTINSVTIEGTKVKLALASPVKYGDIITVSYTKPTNNPLQTPSGFQAASIALQLVVNNCINKSPTVSLSSPVNGSSFSAPATITILANASDADGTITKVEFYNGSTKIGEKSTAPFSFIWNNVSAGTYLLTALAIDNYDGKATSSATSITVYTVTPPVNKPPTVSIISPENERSFTAPATIIITANATDSDGTISNVAFFNGTLKLGEKNTPPYVFNWTKVNSGTFYLTAVATDNSNSTTSSSSVKVYVNQPQNLNKELIKLYPDPNQGHFTIEILNPQQMENSRIFISNIRGEKVYEDILPKDKITKSFELSYLSPGIYILIIIRKDTLLAKNFIKD
jgi:uncharacterized repeat protein (TIGR02059 family)